MIKNYTITFFLTYVVSGILWIPASLFSQEPKIFTLKDFDLKGKVKSCLVITNYGKEEFEFNEEGILTKSVTRYNEHDYDITYYKYQGNEISERRDERYRDGEFDRNTSIAHLYTVDTTGNKKIIEKILSYSKEFLDQYEYQYNKDGKLIKIIRSNNDGLDETNVKYTRYKGETTISHILNGVLQKSIRTSLKKKKNGFEQKIVLTKELLNGTPNKAIEQLFDNTNGKLITEQTFNYDPSGKSFVPSTYRSFEYDDRGKLSRVKTKIGKLEESKEYIYQFDSELEGNWIKKIITPENAYTTRKLVYYKEVELVKE